MLLLIIHSSDLAQNKTNLCLSSLHRYVTSIKSILANNDLNDSLKSICYILTSNFSNDLCILRSTIVSAVSEPNISQKRYLATLITLHYWVVVVTSFAKLAASAPANKIDEDHWMTKIRINQIDNPQREDQFVVSEKYKYDIKHEESLLSHRPFLYEYRPSEWDNKLGNYLCGCQDCIIAVQDTKLDINNIPGEVYWRGESKFILPSSSMKEKNELLSIIRSTLETCLHARKSFLKQIFPHNTLKNPETLISKKKQSCLLFFKQTSLTLYLPFLFY